MLCLFTCRMRTRDTRNIHDLSGYVTIYLHKHAFTLQELYSYRRDVRRRSRRCPLNAALPLLNRALHGVEPDDTRVQEERRPRRAEAAHVLLEGHAQEFHPAVEDEYRGG